MIASGLNKSEQNQAAQLHKVVTESRIINSPMTTFQSGLEKLLKQAVTGTDQENFPKIFVEDPL